MQLLRIIRTIEQVLLLAFATSLPLSHTLCVVIWISGLVLLVCAEILERFFGSKDLPRLQSAGMESYESNATRIPSPPLAVPILILVLAITASGLANGGFDEGWRSFRKIAETVLPYFWVYFVCRRNPVSTRFSVTTLLWVSAIAGIYGGIQQVFNFHPTDYPYLQGTGFLAHPMAFAGQMQVFAMLSLGLLLSDGYKRLDEKSPDFFFKHFLHFSQNVYVFTALVICNFSGLFFAAERSAWLGGAAGVLAIASLRSLKLGALSLFGLPAIGSLLYFVVPSVKKLVDQRIIDVLFSGKDVSVSARQVIWSKCWSLVQESPYLGLGWLKFPHFDIPEAIVPGISKDLNHAHSNYMQFLTTTGVVGLLSYLILQASIFIKSAKKFLQIRKQDQFNAGLAMGVFGAAISLAVSGIFEFNFGGSAQVRLAQWFILGLL